MGLELKPCPFCGSDNVELDAAGHPYGGGDVWVVCLGCGGNGPILDTDEEAAKAWNARSSIVGELMRERIELSKLNPPKASWRATLKIMEELGELAEAVLIDFGSLAYKKQESGTMDEVADMLNGISAFIAAHYPDLSTDEIMAMLEDSGRRKLNKYRKIVLGKDNT